MAHNTEIWKIIRSIEASMHSSFTGKKTQPKKKRLKKEKTITGGIPKKTGQAVGELPKKNKPLSQEGKKKHSPACTIKKTIRRMPRLMVPDPEAIKAEKAALKQRKVRTASSYPEHRVRKGKTGRSTLHVIEDLMREAAVGREKRTRPKTIKRMPTYLAQK